MDYAVYQKIEKSGDVNKDALLYALASLTSQISEKREDFKESRRLTKMAHYRIGDMQKHFQELKEDKRSFTGPESSKQLDGIIANLEVQKEACDDEIVKDQESVHNGIIAKLEHQKIAVEYGLERLGFIAKNRQCGLKFTGSNSYGLFSHGDDHSKVEVNQLATLVHEVAIKHFKIKDDNTEHESDELSIGIYANSDLIEYGNSIDVGFNFPAKMMDTFDAFAQDLAQTLKEETIKSARAYYNKHDFYGAKTNQSKEEAIEEFIAGDLDLPFTLKGALTNYFDDLVNGKSIKEIMENNGMAEFDTERNEQGYFANLGPHFAIEGTTETGAEFKDWYNEAFGGSTGISKDDEGFRRMEVITARIFAEENPELKAKAERMVEVISQSPSATRLNEMSQ